MSRSEAVPEELAHVPRHALESYVRTRVLALAGSVSVSRRLGLSPDVIKQAFIDALMEAAHPRSLPNAERDDPATRLQLVFRHDCLSLGCLDTECSLCAQNPHRRCEGNFAGKYLAGDVLKAKCGASIRVEVLDRTTAESVSAADGLDDIRLEMGILDGKEYASLQDGRDNTEEEVTKCILLLNNQHKELLQPGRGGTITDGKMVNVALQRAQAYLPDLVVTGSSEALLSGQKPPFRLFVRAVHSDGTRAHHIRFAVSEAFVVATPRVRTAAKADIPHVDDHVKMLAGLGNQTQQKLMDINAAAAAVGVFGLQLPHNTVTKVGQFKDLIEMADRDRVLCDTLKKVLKLTKGWDAAREHAMAAVGTDNQMRIWYQDDAMLGGLLFKCQLGCVDLDSPVGLLTKREASGDQTTLEATLMAQLDAGQRETLRRLQREASLSWWQPGHPGWAIWPVDSDGFMKGAQAQAQRVESPPRPAVPQSRSQDFREMYGHAVRTYEPVRSTPASSYRPRHLQPHQRDTSFDFPVPDLQHDHSFGLGLFSGALNVNAAPSWSEADARRNMLGSGSGRYERSTSSGGEQPLVSPFSTDHMQNAGPSGSARNYMAGEEAAAPPPPPSPFGGSLLGVPQGMPPIGRPSHGGSRSQPHYQPQPRAGEKRRSDDLPSRPSNQQEQAKRQNVNLPQLQQRLSQLVGRQLSNAEMSKITGLSNYQDLAASPSGLALPELRSEDLLGIPHDLASLQTANLPDQRAPHQHGLPAQSQGMSQFLGNLSLPGDSGGFDPFAADFGELGNFASAVALLQERDVPDLLQQRRSSVLLSYVDTRLGAPEGQLVHQRPSAMHVDMPRASSAQQRQYTGTGMGSARGSQQGAVPMEGARKSGLDTMSSIGDALKDPHSQR